MELSVDTIKILYTYKTDYKYAFEMVNKYDKMTQDLLHRLELEKLKYNERAVIATMLANVRRDRRYYKDIVECYQPLIDMGDTVKLGSVVSTLGVVIKKINNLKNRNYKPKIKEIILDKKEVKK